MDSEESGKQYWKTSRIVLLAVWTLVLIFAPWCLVHLGAIPDEAQTIPRLLVGILIFPILLDKSAFRAAMAIVFAGSCLSIFQPVGLGEIVHGLDNRLRDGFFNLRGPIKPSQDIIIVDIDRKSVETLGQWPWPRTEVANAVRNLLADGAKVVGFDVVFAEPDRLSLKDWVDRLDNMGAKVDLPQGATASTRVAGKTVKNIVLGDWAKVFQARNPQWHLDPKLRAPERERLLTEHFLAFEKERWQEQEELSARRARRAGVPYTIAPYQLPPQPLHKMAEGSRELFFLAYQGSRGDVLASGADLVMDNDDALAAVFAEGPVVAGGMFITGSSAGSRMAAYRRREATRESQGMVVSASIQGANEIFPGLREALEQITNVEAIQRAALHQGMFNIVPDRFGSARHYTMLMNGPVFQETLVLKEGKEDLEGLALLDPANYEKRIVSHSFTYPSLGLEMLRAANGYDKAWAGYRGQQRGLYLSHEKGFTYGKARAFQGIPRDRFLALDHKADLQINFLGYGGPWQPEAQHGPDHYFRYISLVDVLFQRFEPGTFEGKYVLLGSTDPTLSDYVGSPFRPAFPGLEVHATVLDNLINDRAFNDLGDYMELTSFLSILIGGTLLSLLVAYAQPWLAFVCTFSLLGGLPLGSFWVFAMHNLTVDIVFPWLVGALITAVAVMTNFFVEGRERRFVASQFGKMVSPAVLKRLRDDPAGISLQGQRCEATVMFADLEGFTAMSETMEPTRLVELINAYLTPVSERIMKHHGFIDKFIGDAVMACWGVPYPQIRHAELACEAAVDQQLLINELRPTFKAKYGVNLNCRIGIASGEVCAALMGSDERKNYTVVGDTVNLSARVEPACRDYGVGIIITESTYEAVKEHFVCRCLDKLLVKGKSQPVLIYELVHRLGEVSDQELSKVKTFEDALHAHWQHNWKRALSLLNKLLEQHPGDVAARKLRDRVKDYQDNPPKDGWQGEKVRQSKD